MCRNATYPVDDVDKKVVVSYFVVAIGQGIFVYKYSAFPNGGFLKKMAEMDDLFAISAGELYRIERMDADELLAEHIFHCSPDPPTL